MKKLSDFQLESPEAFQEAYRYSIDNPAKFWAEIASTFQWQQPWKEVLKHDWTIPSTEWFVDGKLNITENCLDRHVAVHPDKEALIWEPNDPDDAVKRYSYKNLLDAVCRFANGLKNQGIKKVSLHEKVRFKFRFFEAPVHYVLGISKSFTNQDLF